MCHTRSWSYRHEIFTLIRPWSNNQGGLAHVKYRYQFMDQSCVIKVEASTTNNKNIVCTRSALQLYCLLCDDESIFTALYQQLHLNYEFRTRVAKGKWGIQHAYYIPNYAWSLGRAIILSMNRCKIVVNLYPWVGTRKCMFSLLHRNPS